MLKLFSLHKLLSRLLVTAIVAITIYMSSNQHINASAQKFLDIYPGASVAYALYPLSTTYKGPLIRVRRGADNATLDVKANVNGSLDTFSIYNFATAVPDGPVPGATAAFDIGYSVRRINPSYVGSALRLRRESGGELDIGFDTDGNLDLAAVDAFLDDSVYYSDTLPLDAVAGATAAYSMRKIKSDYAGPAMTIRRVDNDKEKDINFIASGDLDYISIINFCEGTDCRVTTWYDQSVNGRDAAQTNPNLQPLIYDAKSGLSYAESGQIALDFVHDRLEASAGFDIATDNFSWFYIVESSNEEWMSYFSGESYRFLTNELRSNSGGNVINHARSTDLAIHSSFFDGTSYEKYTNNSLRQAGSYNPPTNSSPTLYIGYNASNNGSESYLRGKVSEFISFDTDVRANRNDIIFNQAKYHSLKVNHGYVTTWYDQSGNGHDATNTNDALQPLLIYSNAKGFLPAHQVKLDYFDGRRLNMSATSNGLTCESAFMVGYRTAFNQSFADISDSVTKGVLFGANTTNSHYNNYYLNSNLYGSHLNGLEVGDRRILASGFGANTSLSNGVIGNDHGSLVGLRGQIQELILYVADQTANRAAIESNMNLFFKLSSSNIYVDTWYDQSGNNNHASQGSARFQPIIYSADEGFILNDGGKATMRFGIENNRTYLDVVFPSPIPAPYSIINYGAAKGMPGVHRDTFYEGATNDVTFAVNPSADNDDEVFIRSNTTVTIPYLRKNWDKDNLYFATFGSEASLYANGNLLGTGDSGTLDLVDLTLGNKGGSQYNHLNGTMSELIVYPNDKTPQRQPIENFFLVQNSNEFVQAAQTSLNLKRRNNFTRRVLIRQKKVFVKLDKDDSRSIEYNELVDSMLALYTAKFKGSSGLNLLELQAVDMDENHTFNNNDENLMRKTLKVNKSYEYVDGVFKDEIQFSNQGDVSLKTASKFITSYKKKRKSLLRQKREGLLNANEITDEVDALDCNNDNQITRQDKICASDLLRNILMKKYPKQQTMKFLKKNKFMPVNLL